MPFHAYQRAFAAHIRDPRGVPRPAGVPARRMRVYNQLLYNNVEGFLLACFPVCRKILGQRRWSRLARAFFRDHVCATPLFRRIPGEFLSWLNAAGLPDGYPVFLPELAHYEWVELDLDTSAADAVLPEHDPDGDLLGGRPLLNPVMHLLTYRWPVHRLSPRFRPSRPPDEATCLLAYRDADFKVRFELINAATARLLTLLRDHRDWTGHQAVVALAGELGHPEATALLRHAGGLLAGLRERGALLGVSRASSRQS